jgi:adenine-specific DNA-methyltransferase
VRLFDELEIYEATTQNPVTTAASAHSSRSSPITPPPLAVRYDAESEQQMDKMLQQGVLTMPDSDAIRMKVNAALEPGRKSALGQFMTPAVIAQFMASLFDDSVQPATLLDAGAGIGFLTIAAVPKLGTGASVDVWEVDPVMRKYLEENLKLLGIQHKVHAEDFIHSAVQQIALANSKCYTHAILNPPYKKLNSDSVYRGLLRKVGIETVNLYSAFVALAVLLMRDQGQVVAIIPRSFCNGPYYRPFRHFLLNRCSLDRIHIFESRSKAFEDDDVLQENVIIKLVRGKLQGGIVVSTSHDQRLTDYRERYLPFSEIVKPNDAERFIHIPTDENETHSGTELFQSTLDELDLQVCTGPVVDFRLKYHWLAEPQPHSIPLIYPHHFSSGKLEYPKQHKKPNALLCNPAVEPWLMPNECYVLVKRFSSKEEKRRVVAYVYNPEDINSKHVGFENHWNVFHVGHHGIESGLANGLACFLNSTVLDKRFRVFSGHTQVNATDLRNMKYPTRRFLMALGMRYRSGVTQAEIDDSIRQTHEQRE